jgi:hypothetical protein
MKTLIILILAGALLAGLYLSKPSQASFTSYIQSQNQPAQSQSVKDIGKSLIGNLLGSVTASTLVYHDHILWATEDLNGTPQYFGMFAHWWKETAPATPAPANPAGSNG